MRAAAASTFGTPVTLFGIGSHRWIDFDVAPDGPRFLALIPEVVLREQPLTGFSTGIQRSAERATFA